MLGKNHIISERIMTVGHKKFVEQNVFVFENKS